MEVLEGVDTFLSSSSHEFIAVLSQMKNYGLWIVQYTSG